MSHTVLQPKWKPGDLVKTVVAHKYSIDGADWKIVYAVILEIKLYNTWHNNQHRLEDVYYTILIQNAGKAERIESSIYPTHTPDEYIIQKENELPF